MGLLFAFVQNVHYVCLMNKTASKEELRLCGIYVIINRYDGMYYIGSTCRTFRQRFVEHRSQLLRDSSDKYVHHNLRMHSAYRKRPECFDFAILHAMDKSDKKAIEEMELFYLHSTVKKDPLCYNVSKVSTPKDSSKTTRDRLAEASRRMWACAHINYNPPGKSERLSEVLKGRKKSETEKVNHKRAIDFQMKPVLCRTTGKIYQSTNDCAKDTGVDVANVSKCCKGVHSQINGYKFSYLKDTDMSKFKIEAKGKKGLAQTKLVLNTLTGVFYDGVEDAAISADIKRATMQWRITHPDRSHTPFIYA